MQEPYLLKVDLADTSLVDFDKLLHQRLKTTSAFRIDPGETYKTAISTEWDTYLKHVYPPSSHLNVSKKLIKCGSGLYALENIKNEPVIDQIDRLNMAPTTCMNYMDALNRISMEASTLSSAARWNTVYIENSFVDFVQNRNDKIQIFDSSTAGNSTLVYNDAISYTPLTIQPYELPHVSILQSGSSSRLWIIINRVDQKLVNDFIRDNGEDMCTAPLMHNQYFADVELLRHLKINFWSLLQEPGEFLILGSGICHQSYSNGPFIAEEFCFFDSSITTPAIERLMCNCLTVIEARNSAKYETIKCFLRVLENLHQNVLDGPPKKKQKHYQLEQILKDPKEINRCLQPSPIKRKAPLGERAQVQMSQSSIIQHDDDEPNSRDKNNSSSSTGSEMECEDDPTTPSSTKKKNRRLTKQVPILKSQESKRGSQPQPVKPNRQTSVSPTRNQPAFDGSDNSSPEHNLHRNESTSNCDSGLEMETTTVNIDSCFRATPPNQPSPNLNLLSLTNTQEVALNKKDGAKLSQESRKQKIQPRNASQSTMSLISLPRVVESMDTKVEKMSENDPPPSNSTANTAAIVVGEDEKSRESTPSSRSSNRNPAGDLFAERERKLTKRSRERERYENKSQDEKESIASKASSRQRNSKDPAAIFFKRKLGDAQKALLRIQQRLDEQSLATSSQFLSKTKGRKRTVKQLLHDQLQYQATQAYFIKERELYNILKHIYCLSPETLRLSIQADITPSGVFRNFFRPDSNNNIRIWNLATRLGVNKTRWDFFDKLILNSLEWNDYFSVQRGYRIPWKEWIETEKRKKKNGKEDEKGIYQEVLEHLQDVDASVVDFDNSMTIDESERVPTPPNDSTDVVDLLDDDPMTVTNEYSSKALATALQFALESIKALPKKTSSSMQEIVITDLETKLASLSADSTLQIKCPIDYCIRLGRRGWIQCGAVDEYLSLIENRSRNNSSSDRKCMVSFTAAPSVAFKSISRKKKNDFDCYLAPIYSKQHFVLFVADMHMRRFSIYNSLGGSTFVEVAVAEATKDYFIQLCSSLKVPENFSTWGDIVYVECPRQKNYVDCGIFACEFAEQISRGNLTISDFDPVASRARILCELMNGILYDNREVYPSSTPSPESSIPFNSNQLLKEQECMPTTKEPSDAPFDITDFLEEQKWDSTPSSADDLGINQLYIPEFRQSITSSTATEATLSSSLLGIDQYNFNFTFAKEDSVHEESLDDAPIREYIQKTFGRYDFDWDKWNDSCDIFDGKKFGKNAIVDADLYSLHDGKPLTPDALDAYFKLITKRRQSKGFCLSWTATAFFSGNINKRGPPQLVDLGNPNQCKMEDCSHFFVLFSVVMEKGSRVALIVFEPSEKRYFYYYPLAKTCSEFPDEIKKFSVVADAVLSSLEAKLLEITGEATNFVDWERTLPRGADYPLTERPNNGPAYICQFAEQMSRFKCGVTVDDMELKRQLMAAELLNGKLYF